MERSFDGGVDFDAGGGLGALHGDGDAGCAALRGRGGVGLGEGLGMRDNELDMRRALLGFPVLVGDKKEQDGIKRNRTQ